MGCIALRCLYIGVTKGFVVEFFKLMGMVFASVVTLHYYIKIAQFLHPIIPIPFVYNEMIAFLFVWFVTVLIFKIIRDGLMILINIEAHPIINKAGGTAVSLIRAALVCSLTFSFIFVTGNKFLIKSARSSVSGYYLVELCPRIYWTTYSNFIEKLFPKDKKNRDVYYFRYKAKE